LVTSDCYSYQGVAGECRYTCDSDSTAGYGKYYCELGSLKVLTNHEDIKKELKANGPMMMGLRVYEDFMSYARGVYKHTTGELVGGHAMKLIGYGVDDREGLYWIMQNQWSTDWGDRGFIKIKEGEIGIDSVALSCMPDIK